MFLLLPASLFSELTEVMIACQNTPGARPFCSCQSGPVWNPGTSLVPIVSSKIPSTTLFLILLLGFSKRVNVIDAKEKKKRRSTCRIRRNNTAVSSGVLKARHLWTNLALSCVAGTHSFEKTIQESLDAESSDGNHSWLGDATSSDSWPFCIDRLILTLLWK